jgi:transcriptional regulator with XRE-family HTH domain
MKKKSSNRRIASLAEKLCAKPSELLELLNVSRSYLHRISTGERPLNGSVLEKINRLQLTEVKPSAKIPSVETVAKKFCERKSLVVQKKIHDLQDALQQLQATQEAIAYITQLIPQLPARSLEHDWCKLHLRRLKHRLPKNLGEQRALLEAELAGLVAEVRYWDNVRGPSTSLGHRKLSS